MARNANPFTDPRVRDYLAARAGVVSVGLVDLTTDRTYLYHPGTQQVTASMVKIDILATLLNEAGQSRRPLSVAEQSLARVMVEDSDNAAAQELWNDIGGHGLSLQTVGTSGGYYALSAFNHRAGFTQTNTDWAWGLLRTTPTDFLRLLRVIYQPSHLLTPSARSYERALMEHVTASQRFGVPSGVPAGGVVGVKNGWYPEPTTGWQLNSAGFVQVGRVRYLAVIMSAHNPDESYGLATLNGVGSLLWRFEASLAASR